MIEAPLQKAAGAKAAAVEGTQPEPVDIALSPLAISPKKPEDSAAREPGNELLPLQDREHNVYFKFGSNVIDGDAEATIKRHAEKLLVDRNAIVSLVGHTDDLGSREYNEAICIKRISAVRQALLDLGVNSKQIRLSHRYAYEQASSKHCRTNACRRLLRRVELRQETLSKR